ncbi:pyridoxal 5'-phosphate synthase subunit pyroA-like [Eutrema salsugineum]|uniref:pyridoxal 5'-phosphate synthase subunit pyroA-like n=1 Tax=Eutrema salsugineum TaxID=72664 RepID=UPI000CED185B|nr:pyridoxal 5'-phosphate synthase subunit pyroA-like [Eutrema salsugineum]
MTRWCRRMPDPVLVKDVKRMVSVPVMAHACVGHFMEAQTLESLAVDYLTRVRSSRSQTKTKQMGRVPVVQFASAPGCICSMFKPVLLRNKVNKGDYTGQALAGSVLGVEMNGVCARPRKLNPPGRPSGNAISEMYQHKRFFAEKLKQPVYGHKKSGKKTKRKS